MSRELARILSRLSLAAVMAATGTLALAQSESAASTPAAESTPAASAPAAQEYRNADSAVMHKRMAARHEKHMANLKTLLKLTPEQETAWTDFTAAMQPPNLPERMSRAERQKLTTPERIELMQKRAAERQAHMKQRGDAIKAFYAQLTPEQQKVFDQQANKMHDRHGPRRSKKPQT
jgi:Spy/CpxP family protein refolding chaperone